MLNLDDLQQRWVAYDGKLDASIRLNRQLLIASGLDKVRSPLTRLTWSLVAESVIQLAVVMALGAFIFDNIATARFALAGAALDVFAVAIAIAGIWMIVMVRRVDYRQPIAGIQIQLERLRIFSIRYTQLVFLIAPLAWVPLMIVAFRGFWGIDAYRVFGPATLVAQLLFGAAVIPLGLWLAKRFSGRMTRSPMMQRVMNDIAGYNLNAATNNLATLAEFAEEPREVGVPHGNSP